MHSGSIETTNNPSILAEAQSLHPTAKFSSHLMSLNMDNSNQDLMSHPSNLYPLSVGSSENQLNQNVPLETEQGTDGSREPDSQSQENFNELPANSTYMPKELEYLTSGTANDGNQGRWMKEEHVLFIEGISLFGKNWKRVEEHVGSRTGAQIRSHAQKFFNKLERTKNKKQSQSTTASTSYLSKNQLSQQHPYTFANATKMPTALLNSSILREKSLQPSSYNIRNQQCPQANQINHEQPSINQMSKISLTSKSSSLHPTLTQFPSSELPSCNQFLTARNRSDSHASCMSATTSVLNHVTDEDHSVKDKALPLSATSKRESNRTTISNQDHKPNISGVAEHQPESQLQNNAKVQWSSTTSALEMMALSNPVAQIQGLISVIQNRLLQTALITPQSLSVQGQDSTSNKENYISQQSLNAASNENDLLNNLKPSRYESFFEFVQSKYGCVFGQDQKMEMEKQKLIDIHQPSKQQHESQENQKPQLLPSSINLKRKSSFTLCESQCKERSTTTTFQNLGSLRKRLCPNIHKNPDFDQMKAQKYTSKSSNNNQQNASLF